MDDQDTGFNVKFVPEDRFSLAVKSALTENTVLPVNVKFLNLFEIFVFPSALVVIVIF